MSELDQSTSTQHHDDHVHAGNNNYTHIHIIPSDPPPPPANTLPPLALARFFSILFSCPPARPEKYTPCILLKQHPSSSRRGRREGKVRSHPPSPLLSPQVLSCEIMHSLGRTMSKGFYTTQACGMAWGIGGFKAGLAPLPVPFAKVEPRAG